MVTPRSKNILNTLIYSPRPAWMGGNVYPLIERLLLDSDEEGRCWDSIETLAYRCGVSESTVKRTLKKLVNFGTRQKYPSNGCLE
jgi:hypothetical protein